MSNFKSGSGNLDFGSGDDDAASEQAENQSESAADTNTTDESATDSAEQAEDDADSPSEEPDSAGTTAESGPTEYPYFVRRSNVGDERDTRLEVHLRDEIAEQEAAFRSALAEELGTNEVAKTDAREFALLAAFHHPEAVAELMEAEGFGELD